MIVRLTIPIEIDDNQLDTKYVYNTKLAAIGKLANMLDKEAFTDLAHEVELEVIGLPYKDG